jgi:hypothetical protein
MVLYLKIQIFYIKACQWAWSWASFIYHLSVTLLWFLFAQIPTSLLLSCPVPENNCCQLSGRCLLILFRLVWWMCVQPLLWLFFGF